MKVNTKDIKKLRKQTSAGVMDCRKALIQCKGDMKKAKKWINKKAKKIAEKKADRATQAGIIEAYIHSNAQVGALVKLTSETDFVARNKHFKKLAHELAMQVAAMNPKDAKELLEQDYIRNPKKKIKDLLKETIAKVGENIKIKKIARLKI